MEVLKASGFKLQIFVNDNKGSDGIYKASASFPTDMRSLIRKPLSPLKFVLLALLFFRRFFRLFVLEKKNGENTKEALRKVYLNAHILKHKLHWLHFEYATLGLKREHVAEALGAKMSLSIRGFDIVIYPLKHKEPYKKLFQKANKIHSISFSLAALARTNGYPPEKEISIIKPAIDTSKFRRDIPVKALQKPLRIITVARLTWKKGLVYAIKAMEILNAKGVDFSYEIVGEGEEYEELIYAIDQLELNDKVLLSGKSDHDTLIRKLYESDIYIQPSIQEGFGNALLEAQAAGLICIGTDAEGIPENIENGKSGYIVPKRSPMAIAKKIHQIMETDEDTLQKMRVFSVNRICENFDLSRQKQEFEIFFEYK
jgi:colanic acid/amylovoran biosynthesis glycosyltransferase